MLPITLEAVQKQLEGCFLVKLHDRREWLRKRLEAIMAMKYSSKGREPFTVLAPAFGHPTIANLAVDVTDRLNALVAELTAIAPNTWTPAHPRLVLTKDTPLLAFFAEGTGRVGPIDDPCPGQEKLSRWIRRGG